MPNELISDLTENTSPASNDLMEIETSGGLSRKVTLANLLTKPTASAPGSANKLNVVGIAFGETAYSNKDLFNTTAPVGLGTATAGTEVQASRSDHVHPGAGVDGWTPAAETWTYASASTINVPTGAASRFQIGDQIKWQQPGGLRYGTISAVADTLLTIIVNTDYVVDNAEITARWYTHSGNAMGWPGWFNWSPSFAGFSSNPSGGIYRYHTSGRLITCAMRQPNAGTSNATTFSISAPVACNNTTNWLFDTWACRVMDNGSWTVDGMVEINYSTPTWFDIYPTGNFGSFTASGNKRLQAGLISYQF